MKYANKTSVESRSPPSGSELGIATLEVALWLPLLLGVLGALIQLGCGLWRQELLDQGARAGAQALGVLAPAQWVQAWPGISSQIMADLALSGFGSMGALTIQAFCQSAVQTTSGAVMSGCGNAFSGRSSPGTDYVRVQLNWIGNQSFQTGPGEWPANWISVGPLVGQAILAAQP